MGALTALALLCDPVMAESTEPVRVVERNGHEFVRLTRPQFWVLSAHFYLGLSSYAIRRATLWVTTPAQNEFMVKRRNQRN